MSAKYKVEPEVHQKSCDSPMNSNGKRLHEIKLAKLSTDENAEEQIDSLDPTAQHLTQAPIEQGFLTKQPTVSSLVVDPTLQKPRRSSTPNDIDYIGSIVKSEPEKHQRKKIKKIDLVKYKLDNHLSTRRGQSYALVLLGFFICLASGFIYSFVNDSRQVSEAIWESWTYMADPGTHSDARRPIQRFVAFGITLLGILFFSVIMGFVVDGIREKMDNLKKGKSCVVEVNHSLILGWTDKTICLIKEICKANESEGGGVIVVLAEQEKEMLEAEIKSQIKAHEFQGTKVVLRHGNPLLSLDLVKVSATEARCIIIMSEHGDADKSDSSVLRILLSLKGLSELNGHIVAEVRDIDNEPLVRLVGGKSVETLVSHDVIGRLVLMSARSPGLAKVYTSVLGFDGDEFYLKEWPQCVGVPFENLVEIFPNAIPIGIATCSGEIQIKPPKSRKMRTGEKILVIAEDDDTYESCEPAVIDVGTVPNVLPAKKKHEQILLCGWRRDIRDMLYLLDSMLLLGSEVHMVCEQPIGMRNRMLLENGLDVNNLLNMRIVHFYGNTAVRRHVENLPLETYTSIMILADQARENDIMHSDSHSLATLLLIRDLQAKKRMKIKYSFFSRNIVNSLDAWYKSKEESCACICELLDPRTQRTIATNTTISMTSEFVQSNELISRILAMISESPEVAVIIEELLGSSGNSLAVENSNRYCNANEKLTFWQVAKRAQFYNEVLCGYQQHNSLEDTVLNPRDKNVPKYWSGYDLVVLVGEKSTDKSRKDQKNIQDICYAFEEGALQRRAKEQAASSRNLHAASVKSFDDNFDDRDRRLMDDVCPVGDPQKEFGNYFESAIDSLNPHQLESLKCLADCLTKALNSKSNI